MTVENAKYRATQMIAAHESFVPHMYLDSISKVTVGYGTMMPTAAATAGINLINIAAKPQRPATEKEKADEWQVLQNLSPAGTAINFVAGHYRQYTSLTMTLEEGRRLLADRLNGFISMLRRNCPGFDDFPEDAQVAMMDMAYNLGNRIHTRFPSFTRAVNKLGGPDWATAARESRRPQLSRARNTEIHDLFMAAHRASVAKKKPALR